MGTTYPGAIDSLTNPTGTDTLNSPSHANQHADANDAIEAIETELGTDPAGSYATVKARIAALPQGQLAYAQVTADQSTIGTGLVDLSGLSVTITVDGTRRVKLFAEVMMQSTVANDRVDVMIREGTTVLQIADVSVGNANAPETVVIPLVLTPTNGSHTYKLSAQRSSGSGSFTSRAGSTNPAFIVAEDLGAA